LLNTEGSGYWKGPLIVMARKYRDGPSWKDQLDVADGGCKEDDRDPFGLGHQLLGSDPGFRNGMRSRRWKMSAMNFR
jgi:hypothetical protein